jgi:hypothetical protein
MNIDNIYDELVLFIEEKFQHNFTSLDKNDKECYSLLATNLVASNQHCIKCNSNFILDISISFGDAAAMATLKYFKDNCFYVFVDTSDNRFDDLTCNEMIIKKIIE